MTTRALAYDLGRTSARAALYVDDERTDTAERSARGTLIDVGAYDTVARTVRDLAGELTAPTVDAVTVGLAGVRQNPAAATRLEALLRELHGAGRTIITSDVTIAHAGALGGRAGVLVLAGTGAATLGVSSSGEEFHVDGWGYLLGDAGSGFDVGRAGLAAALRTHDGRDGDTSLARFAYRRFGPLHAIPAAIHAEPDPARLIATFAADVAEAARTDDATAAGIWRDAAASLGRSAAAAVAQVAAVEPTTSTVSWGGGLFAHLELLLDPLRDELARTSPDATLVPPQGDPLDGAALLARSSTTCLEPTLDRDQRASTDHEEGHDEVSQLGER